MKTVILIACGKKKRREASKAKDLYQGSYFKKTLEYAYILSKKYKADIYILSAKHGLLELDTIINPYNFTLNNVDEKYKKNWSYGVIKKLNKKIKKTDRVIFLAGKNYNKYLKMYYKNNSEPLEGLTMGKKLKRLNELIKEEKDGNDNFIKKE